MLALVLLMSSDIYSNPSPHTAHLLLRKLELRVKKCETSAVSWLLIKQASLKKIPRADRREQKEEGKDKPVIFAVRHLRCRYMCILRKEN